MLYKLTYTEPNGECKVEKYLSLDHSSYETLKHFTLELPKLPGRIRLEEVKNECLPT